MPVGAFSPCQPGRLWRRICTHSVYYEGSGFRDVVGWIAAIRYGFLEYNLTYSKGAQMRNIGLEFIAKGEDLPVLPERCAPVSTAEYVAHPSCVPAS